MDIKKSILLLSFFIIIIIFMGAVSATSLNLTEAELASSGVKNYTEAHNKLRDMWIYQIKTVPHLHI